MCAGPDGTPRLDDKKECTVVKPRILGHVVSEYNEIEVRREGKPTSTSVEVAPTLASCVLRRVQAYVLSNGLPLLVGTLCWLWAETGCIHVNSWTAHFHVIAYQAFHLATMVAVALWFSHNRPREIAPSSWRGLQSPYGLYMADVVSGWMLMHTHSDIPDFESTSLASFFLCRMLLMEVVFDFVHYTTHRLCHEVPLLYTCIHKIHHRDHADLHVGSTLQMHPVDGLLTNTLPLLVTVAVVPLQSRWELHAYAAYKTAQELFGHCGCHIKVRPD